MSILSVLTMCCTVVVCGHSKLKGGAQIFFVGQGSCVKTKKDKEAWNDVTTCLSTSLPCDLLFTPRRRSEDDPKCDLVGS